VVASPGMLFDVMGFSQGSGGATAEPRRVSAVVEVPAELGRLAEVRAFIRREARGCGATDEAIDDLVQAVDELVTNVIEHGYHLRPGTIEVEVEEIDDACVVRIRDEAPPFDPTSHPTPRTDLPLEDRPLGGMGVHLARTLTDGMRHRMLPGGGNELTLEKRL
jgi:serine/threonine-protein kinase RsbW